MAGLVILSDRDIANRMWGGGWTAAERLLITPKPAIKALQPASVDLTLYEIIKIDSGDPNIWRDLDWKPVDITDYDHFGPDNRHGTPQLGYPLMPGQVILASTAETVHIPHDLAARVEGKSTLGRMFITTHQTAGFVDPGFHGKITLEIHNVGPVVQYLQAGMYICQINFTKLSSPALRPYGSEGLGSHYHGQDQATPAR